MDVLDLARLQFALTTSLHWLFVMLTLGVAPLVAVMQTRSVLAGRAAGAAARRAGNPAARNPNRAAERAAAQDHKAATLERMTKFWGQIYVINYVVGIVTGLIMEFQFGLNWSGLSHLVGNVFGAPLALETLIAFFAESTFLGMWIFGWHKLPKLVHLSLIWLVTLTAYASAYWILVANGFMHNPVGFEIRNGVAYLTDFGALLLNPSTWWAFVHILGAALFAGGFLLAGISAYHFLRRTEHRDFFRRSLNTGVATAAIFGWIASSFGHAQESYVNTIQPMKFASGAEQARLQAEMVAKYGPGDYTPPGWIDYMFALMFPFGELLVFVTLLLTFFLIKGAITRWRPLQYFVLAMMPLPFVISVAGWVFREVGRQPWVIYEIQTVQEAVSGVGAPTMLASLLTFTGVLACLAVADWVLIARFARRGPGATLLGDERPYDDEAAEPVPAAL